MRGAHFPASAQTGEVGRSGLAGKGCREESWGLLWFWMVGREGKLAPEPLMAEEWEKGGVGEGRGGSQGI